MRLAEPFVYRISQLPKSPPAIFEFLEGAGPIELREMYATFNMGIGFAVMVDGKEADRCVKLAESRGYQAWIGGAVRKEGSRKAVEIEPLGITFEGDTLQVR
jgi:phosphoribosylformylglycinamidine cyclo-ligase